jgi:hypothetical protein
MFNEDVLQLFPLERLFEMCAERNLKEGVSATIGG